MRPVKKPKETPLDFLVTRKLKLLRRGASASPDSPGAGEIGAEITAYRAELMAKTPQEIQALVNTAKAEDARNHWAAVQLQKELREKQMFFNRPNANADFTHWSRAAYWRLDEAVALCFGKSPGRVNWETVKTHTQTSAFAVQYARLRDLVNRAKDVEQLYEPVEPHVFIAWTKRVGISFPKDLEERVTAIDDTIDWKAAHDAAVEAHDKHTKSLHAQLEQTAQERDALQAKLKELENRWLSSTERELKPRERDSLYKLVIGMAMKGYRYNPNALKNLAVSEIASDLELLGIGLSDDTVRKWLLEAAQLLSPEAAENLE